MLDFRPPKDNPLLLWAAKLWLPFTFKFNLGGLQVKIVGDGKERFKKLGKHVMICPNHSNRKDPEVMFSFANEVGEYFNFIAAREVFDWNHGANGWFLQNMGAYSVVRGAVDRESFKMTVDILSAGKKKLVLFPEGEISRMNESVMPLESGAAHLSFMALDRLEKAHTGEPVSILPLALKYTYRTDVTQQIMATLARIEATLGLQAQENTPVRDRIRAAAHSMLSSLESHYLREISQDSDLNTRITGLREHVLRHAAAEVGVKLPVGGWQLDWVRVIRNALDDYIYADTEKLSDYDEKLHLEKAERLRAIYRDLNRVTWFIAAVDGYLDPPVSQERLVSVIELLEEELFGHVKIKGPRTVFISVGQPINLLELYPHYKRNKKATIELVKDQVARQIKSMLAEIEPAQELSKAH